MPEPVWLFLCLPDLQLPRQSGLFYWCPMNSVIDLIKLHEGLRLRPYQCSAGRWTIGYGHNLEARPIPGRSVKDLQETGITRAEANKLLIQDIESVIRDLEAIDEFQSLDEVRRAVLIDMAFNLGFRGLMQFGKMWKAIARKDWDKAAYEMLDSRWAHQVGQRAWRLADMMMSGEWPTT